MTIAQQNSARRFSLGYSGRTEVKAAEVLGLYKIQNASRDSPSIAWLTQQLRQLGEVRRQPPRLVARQPIGRRATRRSDMSEIGGEVEVRGLRLKRR